MLQITLACLCQLSEYNWGIGHQLMRNYSHLKKLVLPAWQRILAQRILPVAPIPAQAGIHSDKLDELLCTRPRIEPSL